MKKQPIKKRGPGRPKSKDRVAVIFYIDTNIASVLPLTNRSQLINDLLSADPFITKLMENEVRKKRID